MDIKVQPLYGAPETGSIHPLNLDDIYVTKEELEIEVKEMQMFKESLCDAVYDSIIAQSARIGINFETLCEYKDKFREQDVKIKSLQKRLNFMYTWFSILAVAMSTALAALAFAVK